MTGEVEKRSWSCTYPDLVAQYSRRHQRPEQRITKRLEEIQKAWREQPLKEKAYSYLYLDATYLGSHQARIHTTNMLERLFKEVKRRRTKVVVGMFPDETSSATLAPELVLRSSE